MVEARGSPPVIVEPEDVMTRPGSRSAATTLAPLAIVATAALAWLQWKSVTRGIWVDSDVYVMGARTLLHGDDVYANASSVDLRFTYSPFAAAFFVPLALLPVTAARCVLSLLSVAAMATTILVVGRRLALQASAMIWLGVAAAALEPVMRNLLLGQINLILMALILVDLLVLPQPYRGLLVGVAAGIKLTPAVFVVYCLLKKDWLSAVRAAMGFVASVLVGLALSWSSSLSYWRGGFIGLGKFGAGAVVGTDNQSLLAAALRLLGRPELPIAGQALLAISGITLGALAARRSLASGRRGAEVEAIAWVALGGLLASPVSWTHHWVWVIVVLAVLVGRGQRARAALVLFLFWFPLVWMLYTGANYNSIHFPWWKALLASVYVLVGATLLISCAVQRRAANHGDEPRLLADELAERAPTAP